MPVINWIVKEMRKLRKKYLFDMTPEQEDAVKKFAQRAFEKGIETGKEIAIKSISETLTNLAEKKIGE